MSQGFYVDGNLLMTFVTPLLKRQWPDSHDLNRRLRDAILENEQHDTGLSRSNVGGWHSKEELFRWKDPAIGELFQRIQEATQEATSRFCGDAVKGTSPEMTVSGWANVSRDGHYNSIHNHVGYTWSGVYYVALGDSDPQAPSSGIIEFVDPRGGIDPEHFPGDALWPYVRVTPAAGMMLLFPGWLQHWVHPFRGRGERISIAFNIKLRF
jgi:uncharacterized protein (TIGR02466 family)